MKRTQKKKNNYSADRDMADARVHYGGAWVDEHQQNNKNRGLIYRAIIYRAY